MTFSIGISCSEQRADEMRAMIAAAYLEFERIFKEDSNFDWDVVENSLSRPLDAWIETTGTW